jgi:hypothetical protein
MNQLNVSLQHSITSLAAKGWSARKIARELGMHRETAGRYVQPVAPASKPATAPIGSKAGRAGQCAPLSAVIEHGVLADGRRRRPHLFRAVLSHSRKGYSEGVWRQTSESFIRCLENAARLAAHHGAGRLRDLKRLLELPGNVVQTDFLRSSCLLL